MGNKSIKAALNAVESLSVDEIRRYIEQAAKARGIDPRAAVKAARSEGLKAGVWRSNARKNGVREPSYGPFQLLVGGPGTGYGRGLGNVFMEKTGLDPRNPATVKQQIDFALDVVKKEGWQQWYGPRKVGMQRWEGVNRNAPTTATANTLPTAATNASPLSAKGKVGGGVAPSMTGSFFDDLLQNLIPDGASGSVGAGGDSFGGSIGLPIVPAGASGGMDGLFSGLTFDGSGGELGGMEVPEGAFGAGLLTLLSQGLSSLGGKKKDKGPSALLRSLMNSGVRHSPSVDQILGSI